MSSPPGSVRSTTASFLHSEVVGGIVLTAAGFAALAWANSPWRSSYVDLWDHPTHVGSQVFGGLTTVQAWVNGALMAFFFVVVGLEISRERRTGALGDRRTAVVPVAGALGGMLGAALAFVAVNHQQPAIHGWGVPMATDIAFAIGALALLGKRVPPGLRLLLLTLAVADDIGSVIVLAVFYPSHTNIVAIVGAVVVAGLLLVFHRRYPSPVWPLVVGAVVLWALLAAGGVEPALAGVVLGVLIPGRRPNGHDPADRAESAMAPLSAYVILPIFALANAGVTIDTSVLKHPEATGVFVGIVLARVAGKLVGITAACALVVRLGWGRLPEGVRWIHVVGGAAVAGIGFTVPLLIAERAFSQQSALLAASQVGLLVGSVVAFVLGAIILLAAGWRRNHRRFEAPYAGDSRDTAPGRGAEQSEEIA